MVLYFEASTYLRPLFQHPREHRTGANPLPFPATPQDSSSYRPDNLRWHRSQLSTDLMIFQVLTSSIIIFLQDSSHNDRHNLQHHRFLPIQHKPLSWVDWKKVSPTMRQAQLGADVHPAATKHHTHPTHSQTTSLPPSPLQWKAVSMRAGQPIRRVRSTLWHQPHPAPGCYSYPSNQI